MKIDPNDRNKNFTKRLLNDFSTGLLELLQEKKLESVTVAQLCEKVSYPRSTFYNYFDDIYDLMDYCWEAIGNQINLADFQNIEHDKRTLPLFDMVYDYMETNRRTDEQILELKEQIANQVTGKHMHLTMPYLTGVAGKKIYDSQTRRTGNLTLEDTCIGCGMCARKCPVHAIEMLEKRPVWVKDKCTMCLGCLHRCPKFAIQYGSKTRVHGQYQHK